MQKRSRSPSSSASQTERGTPRPRLTQDAQPAENSQTSRLRTLIGYLHPRNNGPRQNPQPPSRSTSYSYMDRDIPYASSTQTPQSAELNQTSRLRTSPDYITQRSNSYRSNSQQLPRSDPLDVQDYIHDIRKRASSLQDPLPSRVRDRLDPRVFDAAVSYDRSRNHANHMSKDIAYQFDMRIPHILDIMRSMLDKYDTITVYSSNLLDEGMIIYYPEPFVVPPNASVPNSYWIGQDFDMKVKVKGRFAVLLRKYGQHLKVAPIYTFNGLGLSAKPRGVWREYVQLTDRLTEELPKDDGPEEGEIREEEKKEEGDGGPKPPNRPLLISKLFCDVKDMAMAHLLTTSVSLSSQIMIAGRISSESLDRLSDMVAKLDG